MITSVVVLLALGRTPLGGGPLMAAWVLVAYGMIVALHPQWEEHGRRMANVLTIGDGVLTVVVFAVTGASHSPLIAVVALALVALQSAWIPGWPCRPGSC